MDQLSSLEFIIRLVFASVLGGAIGLERNYRAKEAGFRTHFLVALGSALFMLVSQYGFDTSLERLSKISWDPSRIASQVVTGIGFIGAGTIIFQKHVIRGLTTAAGLWVTSAIGLTCGAGMYVIAAAGTVLVLFCLEALNFLLMRFGSRNISLTFTTHDKEDVSHIIRKLKHEGIHLGTCNMKEHTDIHGRTFKITMEVKIKRRDYEHKLLGLMEGFDDVDIESID